MKRVDRSRNRTLGSITFAALVIITVVVASLRQELAFASAASHSSSDVPHHETDEGTTHHGNGPQTNPPQTHIGPTVLATGPDPSADGYLRVTVDPFGSWGDFAGAGLSDHFNPSGPDTGQPIAFSSGFFIFVPARGQRELLSSLPDWLAIVDDDVATRIDGENNGIAADLNGDGVADATASSFSMTGGGTDLTIDLSQAVRSLGGGSAEITQVYAITNHEASTIEIELVRNFDGDLMFDDDFGNDEVGTTSSGDGSVSSAYIQEPGRPETRVVISGDATAYYGGKSGIRPGNADPAYGFGTDLQIYDTLGLPTNWVDHIAGVGYRTEGNSGSDPAGCDENCDAFIGLKFKLKIESGATERITLSHTYGAVRPPKDPCLTIVGECPGTVTIELIDLTPHGIIHLYWSSTPGSDGIGPGFCQQPESGLDNPLLLATLIADADGTATLDSNGSAALCGKLVQAVDTGAACALSNVTGIPSSQAPGGSP